jgi:hypothetical protein
LFIFPEAFLCDHIKFFKSAFQNGFRESTEKSIDLPEDDPVAFSFIIDHTLGNGSEMKDKVLPENVQLALCKAYVLADKLGCLDAVQETVDNDLHVVRQWEHDEDFESRLVCRRASRFVYENTPESASIRKTIVRAATGLYHSPTYFSAERMKMWLESATSHPKFHTDIMVSIRNESVPGKAEW